MLKHTLTSFGQKASKNLKIKLSKSSKKSKKSLPPIDTNIHLSNYGYSLDKTEKARKTSLKRASKKEGSTLPSKRLGEAKLLRPILKRLNLIRNYTSIKSNKTKMTKDVDFLKKEYKKEKMNKLKK
jgi:hypothetical protein